MNPVLDRAPTLDLQRLAREAQEADAATAPAPARAAYVPFDDSKVELVETEELDAWRAALRTQLGNSLQSISAGAPLDASGSGKSCQYCDMRGLCRKGQW